MLSYMMTCLMQLASKRKNKKNVSVSNKKPLCTALEAYFASRAIILVNRQVDSK